MSSEWGGGGASLEDPGKMREKQLFKYMNFR